jgi:hypothetical protein|tara:strand:+ start:112 stop:2634 length:2523 start_codon:yes stop_codon:yes gene_type:complete
MNVPLRDMRRVLMLVLLLLIPSAWAGEGDDWTVEVEDPFGNPISNCDVTLSDPWTGSVLNEPVNSMYQASAICEGYVVMWHPPIPTTQTIVVLEAYPLVEDLFSVEGAHTIQVLGSTWEAPVIDGPVEAPIGIPVLVIGDGGSEVRHGQNQVSIPNATISYNLSGNYSEDISVSAFHTGSGQSIEWIDGNLTVGEYGGGWNARVMSNGMPKGEAIWPPTIEWINAQLNHSATPGYANLEFTSSLTPNENITGLWTASHVFSDGLGLPFIPGVHAGIASQIDRFLNGDVNELESLLETVIYSNGREALCCIVDDGPVMFTSFEIDAEIDLATGTWGWNETGTITAVRSNIDMLRLEVPFQNDLRQTTPLTITTDGNWQYLSSPLGEWIDGSTANFTLLRDDSSISGYYTITLGPNSAPVVSMQEDYSLPWENTSYNFEAVIEDAPLSVHTCDWDISGSSQNIGVNLSSFAIDSIIPISVTCIDEGGLSDSWNSSYVLDGGTPWINASDDVQIIEPGLFDWDLMVGDDHDNDLRVFWTSNKSEDWWYTGDVLHTSFSVDSNLNSINDNLSERHMARNPVEYWLSAEVTDDVGHSTNGNWTIRLSDTTGPVILGSLEFQNDGNEWLFSNMSYRPGDRVRLNLTESFDDHSSIDKINFTIETDGEVYSELSWYEAQFWELPELGTGYHQITIKAYDELGNLASSNLSIAISPPIAKNLEVIDISSSAVEVEPGMNKFWVTVQNNGAGTTEFMLCSNDRCVNSIVGPSSYSQNATAIVFIEADLDWFETFTVELSYLDDDNQMVVKHSTSDYDAGAGLELIELLGIVIVIGVAIAWYRTRNEPRF